MKKLITTLVIGLALSILNTSAAFAAHYWEFQVSRPQATGQPRTYNVEYVTLSEDSTDQITVKLYQDGSQESNVIGSQTTTQPFGDSGSFTVTVPADGTHTYFMQATSSVDGDVKTTGTITVTSSGNTSTVVVTPASSSTTTPTSSGGFGAGGTDTVGSVEGQNTDGTADGDTSNQVGQVGDQAATDNQNTDDVLGAETSEGSSSRNLIWVVLGIL